MQTRSLLTLLLACLATWAAAAPAPKPRPWVTEWKEVDPDKDCKFVRDGAVLTIEVPGKELDEVLPPPFHISACLLRPVEGDFVVEVRVGGLSKPSAPANGPLHYTSVGAGIVVMDGDAPYLKWGREWPSVKKAARDHASLAVWRPPIAGSYGSTREGNYLRLARKGETFSASFSADGKKWVDLRTWTPDLPAKLRLGVFAASTSSAPFKPRFDHFKLTLKGKKARR